MAALGLSGRLLKSARALVLWEANLERHNSESALDKQAEASAAGEASITGSIKSGAFEALKAHVAAFNGPSLASHRGPVGESFLHLAYLYDRPEMARFLLEREVGLVRSYYEGKLFRGENALHITIACQRGDEARFLLNLEPDLLYSRAEGGFFHRSGPDSTAYYGEYPLSFAVSTNQADIVRMLVVEKGAWISAGDRHGNTAAHLAVHHDRYEMYELLEDLWNKGYGRPPQHATMPLSAIRNAEGQTPLVYASALGNADLFEKLLTRSRELNWSWGNLSSWIYPLDFVDEISQLTAAQVIKDAKAKGIVQSPEEKAACWYRIFGPEAAYVVPPTPHFQPFENDRKIPKSALIGPFPTALEVAVRGGQEDHDKVIMSERVAELLRKKWEHFGERRFRWRVGSTLLYLLIFAAAAVMRTELVSAACDAAGADGDDAAALCFEQALFRWPNTCPASLFGKCVAATLGEWIVLLGAVRKLLWMAGRARMVGWRRFIATGGAGFVETILPTAACLLILAGFGVDFFLGARPLGAGLLSAGSVLGWLYFGAEALLGHEGTGSFVITIRKILSSDLVRFAVLAAVVIFGFTQAFFLMGDSRGVSGFGAQMYELLVTMLSPSIEPDATLPYLRVIYVLLACTLMVNLLVALMGDTFDKITGTAAQKFRLERTRMILAFDQDTSPRARLNASEAERYWMVWQGRPAIQAVDTDDAVFPGNDAVAAAVKEVASLPRFMEAAAAAARTAGVGAGRSGGAAGAGSVSGDHRDASAAGATSGAGAMPSRQSPALPASPLRAAASTGAGTSSEEAAAVPPSRGGRSAAKSRRPAPPLAAVVAAAAAAAEEEHDDDDASQAAPASGGVSTVAAAAASSTGGRRVRAASRGAAAAKGRSRH